LGTTLSRFGASACAAFAVSSLNTKAAIRFSSPGRTAGASYRSAPQGPAAQG
jgi:hypothetical protein